MILDQDGDGRLDVFVSGGGRVTGLRDTGSGELAVHEVVDVGDNPVHLAAGDLNGDGRMDLVTANDGGDRIAVLLGRNGPK